MFCVSWPCMFQNARLFSWRTEVSQGSMANLKYHPSDRIRTMKSIDWIFKGKSTILKKQHNPFYDHRMKHLGLFCNA